ncbi:MULTISPECIES: curlin subunit CsgB [Aliivibrio]|uniref:Curlin subunit CsgB n=1 Tax=Aliivibrio finisterrensis TaxID=511998 RepID=A0A4Q5L2J4_9GAMM|nr:MULTISPECIES: curlin subunit CsgB [Aliivibrio]MDD9174367.1 curlin subunit CsgB [Aliivibrio sp. S3TY1]MDD9178326.1 curlin subunit CsgB [Aliivibrio sp. A6]MDD9191445.1 curlin subunit CsgB [Aliivibrio sp. S2TY2]RYU54894.1 curlin subunit CsgB [Aliivibrio finisterrensis]RYU56570.1 curlin subunit CsgB [Aliivibrio finisterrensis]
MIKLSVSYLYLLLAVSSYTYATGDLGINEFNAPDELTLLSELNTGHDNNAIVELTNSTNSRVIILQHNVNGAGSNKAKVQQAGYNNNANIVQLGSNNTGLISQNGTNNSASLEQWGTNHEGAILQNGNDNIAHLTQTGNGKQNVVNQTGDSNIAAAVNKNNGAGFSINQTGNQGIILVNGMDRFISIIN